MDNLRKLVVSSIFLISMIGIAFQVNAAIKIEEVELQSPGKIERQQIFKNDREEQSESFEYTINVGDVLHISVWQEEGLSEEVIVRPDGRISFPLTGDILAKGSTFSELKEEIILRLEEYIKYPVVSISLKQMSGKKVTVLGQVKQPGVYSLAGKNTVLEAIGKAQGFTADAVPSSTILIRGGLENPQGQRLNLNRTIDKGDMRQNIAIQPGDIIYVPKKFIANVGYALRQILEPIFSAKGLSEW